MMVLEEGGRWETDGGGLGWTVKKMIEVCTLHFESTYRNLQSSFESQMYWHDKYIYMIPQLKVELRI